MSAIPKTHRRPRPVAAGAPDDRGGELAPGVMVHVGDCRDVLPTLEFEREHTVVITDPPWPNAPTELLREWRVDDLRGLLSQTFSLAAARARRLVVVLGCACDPRALNVPESMPFVRLCWLRYALPSPYGTVLNSGDVAYVFGSHEAANGKTLLPGECTATVARANEGAAAQMHPCARRFQHMRWLVSTFTHEDDTVLDPFAGSGTTLEAAHAAGRRAIGIERHAPYVAGIRERFRQQSIDFRAVVP